MLVLAGKYGSFSLWIQSEIEAAQENDKPILGVEPNGQQRIPQEVRNAAREMVGWRSESVIAAIRRVVARLAVLAVCLSAVSSCWSDNHLRRGQDGPSLV